MKYLTTLTGLKRSQTQEFNFKQEIWDAVVFWSLMLTLVYLIAK